MFIHGTLLYLSLDGVIPEAFIYVYIPYNISCVSSVDRTGDKRSNFSGTCAATVYVAM